ACVEGINHIARAYRAVRDWDISDPYDDDAKEGGQTGTGDKNQNRQNKKMAKNMVLHKALHTLAVAVSGCAQTPETKAIWEGQIALNEHMQGRGRVVGDMFSRLADTPDIHHLVLRWIGVFRGPGHHCLTLPLLRLYDASFGPR